MTEFFIPLINEKKIDRFTSFLNFIEIYFSFGTRCYKFVYLNANGTIDVIESKLSKQQWLHTVLKIASLVVSLGIFPLVLFIIKSLYRIHHPLRSINPLFASHLENQPITILYKIFTEFLPSTHSIKYALLNKHFDAMINDDLMKWEKIYKKMTEGLCKEELDLFIQRVKTLYTQGKEPSFKQKVKYLCWELWEEAEQICSIQDIIKNEKLTIVDLTKKSQYDRFRALIQPYRDVSLLNVMRLVLEQNQSIGNLETLLNTPGMDTKEKADLIRDWFRLKGVHQELMKITEINVQHFSLGFLSIETLAYMARMSNLRVLNLIGNNLYVLPAAIGNLTQLKELSLCQNSLSALPPTIGNLNQLRKLDLSLNKFSNLPESIGNLTQLKELRVSHNKLCVFPKGIGKLNQLQILGLSGNKLSNLPDSIGNLIQLKELNLNENELSSLPEGMKNLSHLQILKLEENRLLFLSEVMGSLSQLKALKILNLDNNGLSTLSESFADVAQLEEVSLSGNKLSTLPESFGKLKQLKTLNLNCNQFSDIPNAIVNLNQLERLYLVSNKLANLPESFGKLTQLKALCLGKNKFSVLPDVVLSLTQLKDLYLNHNQLVTLPNAITNLSRLKVLDLGDNRFFLSKKSIQNLLPEVRVY